MLENGLPHIKAGVSFKKNVITCPTVNFSQSESMCISVQTLRFAARLGGTAHILRQRFGFLLLGEGKFKGYPILNGRIGKLFSEFI